MNVANSKNDVLDLINRLSRAKLDGVNVSKLLSSTNLIQNRGSSTRTPRLGNAGDTRALSINSKSLPIGINFGKPASTKTTASNSGSAWATLLKQTASGGIVSAVTGTLGSIGGIGSLVSGILSLFGGGNNKSTPPPLVEFQLPASQDQTVYVSSKGSTVLQGGAEQSSSPAASVNGIYGGAGATATSSTTAHNLQYRSAEIAQAVKHALLNSSSLNDVIADI